MPNLGCLYYVAFLLLFVQWVVDVGRYIFLTFFPKYLRNVVSWDFSFVNLSCASQIMDAGHRPLMGRARMVKNLHVPEAFKYQYAVPAEQSGGHALLSLPTSGASFLDAYVYCRFLCGF